MDPRGRLISFGLQLVSCAIDCVAFLSLSISAEQKLWLATSNAFWRSNLLALLFCNLGEECSGVVGI